MVNKVKRTPSWLTLQPLTRREQGSADRNAILLALNRLDELALSEHHVSALREVLEASRAEKKAGHWKDPAAASKLVELVTALYKSRRVSTPLYVFLASARVDGVHEGRWLDDYYLAELGPIQEAMNEVKTKHGLAPDEDWALGEGPEEYLQLDAQYNSVLDKKRLDTFREFGLEDLADPAAEDPKEFERLRERGRRSVFFPDNHVAALRDVVLRYEEDARLAASVKAYSAAVTSLGAGVEGLLLLRCLRSPHKASRIARTLPKAHRPKRQDDPMSWTFENLVEVCKAAGWLPPIETSIARYSTAELAHFLRRLRNHVHPGRYVRERPWLQAEQRDDEDAEAFYIVLLSTLGNIRRGLANSPGAEFRPEVTLDTTDL